MEKYGKARHATNDNIYGTWLCMLDTKGTDTHSQYLILTAFASNSGYVNGPQCYVYTCIAYHFVLCFERQKILFNIFIYVVAGGLKIKIYRTIILPVVLYGCETWSLTLREERRLRVF